MLSASNVVSQLRRVTCELDHAPEEEAGLCEGMLRQAGRVPFLREGLESLVL